VNADSVLIAENKHRHNQEACAIFSTKLSSEYFNILIDQWVWLFLRSMRSEMSRYQLVFGFYNNVKSLKGFKMLLEKVKSVINYLAS